MKSQPLIASMQPAGSNLYSCTLRVSSGLNLLFIHVADIRKKCLAEKGPRPLYVRSIELPPMLCACSGRRFCEEGVNRGLNEGLGLFYCLIDRFMRGR